MTRPFADDEGPRPGCAAGPARRVDRRGLAEPPARGLRDPLTPDKALTPNEKYATAVAAAGYVPVPLGPDDFIELLPATWRVINSYGVRIAHRTYDGAALNPYRRQHSGVTDRRRLWEVHHDPYDISRVWVRNHHGEGWLQAGWTHLRTAPVPFGADLGPCP